MISGISRMVMIFGIISAINITKIEDGIRNPMMWICLICIAVLYVCQGVKNDN
jgi:hypothetical protein